MDVLISGAGIAGLTLAWCLDRAGHRVLVVERAKSLRGEGYMIDFVGSGYDASVKLGLIPELEQIHYPISRLIFVDEKGEERASLSYPVVRRRLFGGRHFNFMRGDLERVLFRKIEGRVEIRFDTTVDAIDRSLRGTTARLSDGTTGEFDLVVGADGVHSRIRDLAFGNDDRFTRFVGCYTAAFILDHRPARLDSPDAFTTVTVPGRQVAVYPIRGDRVASFFLHRAERRLEDLSHSSALRELERAYGNLGWIVPELLDCAESAPHLYFDAVTQIEMPRWSRDRIVLLGDACQCVSLLAGQGASMAVAGAYILAEELERSGDRYIGGALARYEERMKPNIEQKQVAGRRMADWFVPANHLRLALRDLGLKVALWPGASAMIRKRLAADSVFRA